VNRKELNEHMFRNHKGFYRMYDEAVEDGKGVVHSLAHLDRVMDNYHSHDSLTGETTFRKPMHREAHFYDETPPAIEDRGMRKALNRHMEWCHSGARLKSHQHIHSVDHLELDHTHAWPIILEDLLALNKILIDHYKQKRDELKDRIKVRKSGSKVGG